MGGSLDLADVGRVEHAGLVGTRACRPGPSPGRRRPSLGRPPGTANPAPPPSWLLVRLSHRLECSGPTRVCFVQSDVVTPDSDSNGSGHPTTNLDQPDAIRHVRGGARWSAPTRTRFWFRWSGPEAGRHRGSATGGLHSSCRRTGREGVWWQYVLLRIATTPRAALESDPAGCSEGEQNGRVGRS